MHLATGSSREWHCLMIMRVYQHAISSWKVVLVVFCFIICLYFSCGSVSYSLHFCFFSVFSSLLQSSVSFCLASSVFSGVPYCLFYFFFLPTLVSYFLLYSSFSPVRPSHSLLLFYIYPHPLSYPLFFPRPFPSLICSSLSNLATPSSLPELFFYLPSSPVPSFSLFVPPLLSIHPATSQRCISGNDPTLFTPVSGAPYEYTLHTYIYRIFPLIPSFSLLSVLHQSPHSSSVFFSYN